MNQFEQKMTEFWEEEFPETWSFLQSPEEAQEIPIEHKDQIHFLNKEGTSLIEYWIWSSKMLEGIDLMRYNPKDWQPFNPEYFKTTERYHITEGCDKIIKNGYIIEKYRFQNMYLLMLRVVENQ